MALITLEEAKAYLRLDSAFEDSLVEALLSSAEHLCGDVARLSDEQYAAVFGGSDDSESSDEAGEGEVDEGGSDDDEISAASDIRGETDESDEDEPVYTDAELAEAQNLCRVGSLYALAYIFEHREEADYHDLVITLRSILFPLREDKVQ